MRYSKKQKRQVAEQIQRDTEGQIFDSIRGKQSIPITPVIAKKLVSLFNIGCDSCGYDVENIGRGEKRQSGEVIFDEECECGRHRQVCVDKRVVFLVDDENADPNHVCSYDLADMETANADEGFIQIDPYGVHFSEVAV